MGGDKPKPIKTPFEQKTTYAPVSISGTPEAKALLDVPLDFEDDPGAGRRADLEEQEATSRWDSAFMAGVPSFLREQMKSREMREIRSRGAAETASAEADAKNRRIAAELERRRLLLPQIASTGQSGYNTQLTQPQPSIWGQIAQGAGSALGGLASGGFI